jgi:hypothetical protein
LNRLGSGQGPPQTLAFYMVQLGAGGVAHWANPPTAL